MKIVAITLFGVLLSAQTANVTILNPADAKEAFATYRAMKDAEKNWEALQIKLKRTYGIERDMEFSTDFKAIVQKDTTSIIGFTANNGTLQWNGSFGSGLGQTSDHPPQNYQEKDSLTFPCTGADRRSVSQSLTGCVAW